MSSVVVYGDVSPNVIDGSSIWLMSISEVLSDVFDEVHIQLKSHPQNRTLLSAIDGIANIHIHAPESIADDAALSTTAAAELVERLVKENRATAVVVRGFQAVYDFSLNEKIQPMLWSYVTDLPFPPKKLSDTNVQRLKHIAECSRRIFAQTEAARSYWEALVPQAAGKVLLIPPMIPDFAFNTARNPQNATHRTLKIVYAGKLAREWRTLEMLELPQKLKELGIDAQLDVVGAKFNRAKDDPQWVGKMREALEKAHANADSGVTWLGALPRTESIERIMAADLGFGWRTAELDSSLEVSTKALEYGAAGAAPIVNETEDHRQLWGENYPFFVRADDTVEEVARRVAAGLPLISEARQKAAEASEYFSMSKARERFMSYFERAGSLFTTLEAEEIRQQRIVVASHDLKFMGELMEFLTRNPSFEVRQDKWITLHTHDEETSRELADWADTVFCEWAGPSLAWYSNNLPDETKLVARLHRFELDGPWMEGVAWDKVDKMIFVSDWVRKQAIARFGLAENQTMVLPNTVDLLDFDRPKTSDAQFALGLVGMVPFLKRPDRALDLIEQLAKIDERYILRIKGRMPWEYPHVWSNPVQKQLYLDFFERIARSELLTEHVVFDPFSADIASWHRGVGYILSPSELESFHLAPAEGMAARTIPVFWQREGVKEVFGDYAQDCSPEDHIKVILEGRENESFKEMGSAAREYSRSWDVTAVMPQWEQILAH
ncbi:glycosyltransferase [Corynebacterium singulare]|uniref:Glycosyltransferase n=1 Tax=Corynebacterium singulare TaxID=161899 RepID=A0ABS9PSQ9_9CORY|nr:glycosyltransferase [Corynebacterium singulare]MCG7275742.1 glycosyltransferase [Corynebacterium singulare]